MPVAVGSKQHKRPANNFQQFATFKANPSKLPKISAIAPTNAPANRQAIEKISVMDTAGVTVQQTPSDKVVIAASHDGDDVVVAAAGA